MRSTQAPAMALVAALGVLFSTASLALDEMDIAGLYEVIEPAQRTARAGHIEVLEVFWYRCPHCNAFQPYIEAYLRRKPAHVAFRRMPAVFRDSWIPHARIYLVAEALGVTDRLHRKVFAAIHREKRSLERRADVKALFLANGVQEAAFDDAFDAPAIEQQLGAINRQAVALGVRGVPTVIINGRYRTSGALAGSYEAMIDVIDVLVEKERVATGL